MKRLKQRVAVVTGAGQGLGQAIATALASEGATVVLGDVNLAAAESAAREIAHAGGEAMAVQVDVIDEGSVASLRNVTLERFGDPDILVNNAGIYPRAMVVEMPEDEWDRVLDINIGGHFLCSRAFVPGMKRRGSGRIVCTASAIAYKGAKGFAHYAASKAAVLGFVRALARELAPDGITVNSIAPGTANTSMPRQLLGEDELRDRAAKVPLGRIAEPEDIASAVVFLASDAAAYITGQSVVLTGGDFML